MTEPEQVPMSSLLILVLFPSHNIALTLENINSH